MRVTPAGSSSRALLLAVCAALAACSPTDPSEVLDARIVLEADVVRSGTSSVAHVEVTNHGSRAIGIEVVTCPPRVFVDDRFGKRVGQPSVLCPAIPSPRVSLEPGETHAWIQGWFVPRPPGVYRVRAWVAPVGGGLPVLTNRAIVTVREP